MTAKNYYHQLKMIISLVLGRTYQNVLVFVGPESKLSGIKNDFWELLKQQDGYSNVGGPNRAILGPIPTASGSRVRIVFLTNKDGKALRGSQWDLVLFLTDDEQEPTDPAIRSYTKLGLRLGPMPLWFDGEKVEVN